MLTFSVILLGVIVLIINLMRYIIPRLLFDNDGYLLRRDIVRPCVETVIMLCGWFVLEGWYDIPLLDHAEAIGVLFFCLKTLSMVIKMQQGTALKIEELQSIL